MFKNAPPLKKVSGQRLFLFGTRKSDGQDCWLVRPLRAPPTLGIRVDHMNIMLVSYVRLLSVRALTRGTE